MNANTRLILLAIIALIATNVCGADMIQEENPAPAAEYAAQLLDRIVFPSFSATNITMIDFAFLIVNASIEHDPQHNGMSVIVNSSSLGTRADTYEWKRFSMAETNITYRHLIEKACALSECKWFMDRIPIIEPK